MKTGIELITQERTEQIEKHGYTLEHDEHHYGGALAKVAATLAVYHTDARVVCPDGEWGSGNDPWFLEGKLGRDTIHCLKVAGALIASEIDRIQLSNSQINKSSN